jgi:hypothetical protein
MGSIDLTYRLTANRVNILAAYIANCVSLSVIKIVCHFLSYISFAYGRQYLRSKSMRVTFSQIYKKTQAKQPALHHTVVIRYQAIIENHDDA